jgi:hypothetical protein
VGGTGGGGRFGNQAVRDGAGVGFSYDDGFGCRAKARDVGRRRRWRRLRFGGVGWGSIGDRAGGKCAGLAAKRVLRVKSYVYVDESASDPNSILLRHNGFPTIVLDFKLAGYF